VHARLERLHEEWSVVDDGLSRNGTFVGGIRVGLRRRLRDGDPVRVGSTVLWLRTPRAGEVETAQSADVTELAALSAADRRVLIALCRPLTLGQLGAQPPGNRELAAEVHLSVDGVKARIRALFTKLDIDDLPHHHKRAELARRALAAGLVTAEDLRTSRDVDDG
jgi:pSer/pThr/pTyr-binding forkhead associated (FHA) protein